MSPVERRTPNPGNDPPPASPGREPPASAPIPAIPGEILHDLQTLLSAAVGRIHAGTGCERVTAWALRDTGEPYVAAACFAGQPPAAPVRGAFDALCALAGPTLLDEPHLPAAVRRIAERLECFAATPVTAGEGAALAVLLVGSAGRADERMRARTLAALESGRRRLAAPLAAALAAGRLRALDHEVRRLDRLAALGRLAGEIAHEIRNPLVTIKTFLDLVPERRDDREFLTHFAQVAADEVRRLERLLDLVLERARPGCEGGAGDVRTALDAAIDLLRLRAMTRGVTLDASLPESLPRVALDDDALHQALLNLALNAIDASPPGGVVWVRAAAERGGVRLCVADSGSGVPTALRARVFEPFFSTRGSGAGGLGLAITRRLVEDAGGEIAVGDAEIGGAELRVWLPSAG